MLQWHRQLWTCGVCTGWKVWTVTLFTASTRSEESTYFRFLLIISSRISSPTVKESSLSQVHPRVYHLLRWTDQYEMNTITASNGDHFSDHAICDILAIISMFMCVMLYKPIKPFLPLCLPIIRPPGTVVSDGLLFYRRCLFRQPHLRGPSADRRETLPHDRNLARIAS